MRAFDVLLCISPDSVQEQGANVPHCPRHWRRPIDDWLHLRVRAFWVVLRQIQCRRDDADVSSAANSVVQFAEALLNLLGFAHCQPRVQHNRATMRRHRMLRSNRLRVSFRLAEGGQSRIVASSESLDEAMSELLNQCSRRFTIALVNALRSLQPCPSPRSTARLKRSWARGNEYSASSNPQCPRAMISRYGLFISCASATACSRCWSASSS